STVIVATSSEGPGTIPRVPDKVKGASEAKADLIINWGLEDESDYLTESDELKGVEKEKIDEEEIKWVSTDEEEEKQDDDDEKSINIEKTDDEEETNDEFVHSDVYVHGNVDEEMKDAEVPKTGKGKEEILDAAKADAKKTKEVKDNQVKDDSAQNNQEIIFASTTQKSFRLSISSGFGNQSFNLSFDTSLIGTTKEYENTKINSLLDLTRVTLVTTLPPLSSVTNIILVPAAVDNYLGSSFGDALQKVLRKHTNDLIQQSSQKDVSKILKTKKEQVEKHQMPKYSVKSSDEAALEESQLSRFSRHDVYSSIKILSVKSVTVNKLHGYSYLEEIVVKSANRQLYKFKEGDFVNLHLNDIKDMILLVFQHKLFHLDGKVIVDLAVTLRYSIFVLVTTNTCQDESSHKKRVGIMVDLIDKLMLERQIIRNLERLMSARELEMDYTLMQRTV
nr:hypothetical protein [Tanacetum cinerariifolium]